MTYNLNNEFDIVNEYNVQWLMYSGLVGQLVK